MIPETTNTWNERVQESKIKQRECVSLEDDRSKKIYEDGVENRKTQKKNN